MVVIRNGMNIFLQKTRHRRFYLVYILPLENLTRDEGDAVGSLWVFGDRRDEQRMKHFYNKFTHSVTKIE